MKSSLHPPLPKSADEAYNLLLQNPGYRYRSMLRYNESLHLHLHLIFFLRLNFAGEEEFFAGRVTTETDMALIFISRSMIEVFADSKHVFIDGTFQTVPKYFYQPVTIHLASYGNVRTQVDFQIEY